MNLVYAEFSQKKKKTNKRFCWALNKEITLTVIQTPKKKNLNLENVMGRNCSVTAFETEAGDSSTKSRTQKSVSGKDERWA